MRGHAALVTPPPSFSGAIGALKYTYGWEGPYLVSNKDAGYVIGVGWGAAVAEGVGKREEFLGCTDDSVVLPGVKKCESSKFHGMRSLELRSGADLVLHVVDLAGYMQKQLAWGEEADGEGLTRIWTGPSLRVRLDQRDSQC